MNDSEFTNSGEASLCYETIQKKTLTRPSGTLSQRKRVINAPQKVKNNSQLTILNSLSKRVAFTLAEGATHVVMSDKIRKAAFTLAEVLITLAIIGVVAALTIPTLIAPNQQRGWDTAASVFERKLQESLKVMNTQNTLAGYNNTRSFVNELSKHLKIIKVCDNNNLASCFEDKVNWNIINISHPEQKTSVIDISSIKTASDLGKDDWNTQVLGFQLNNGTSGLLAYNPKCRQDQFNNQITGTSCVSVIYDTSGFSKPNTFTKDVRSVNSSLGKCAFVSDSACFGAPFLSEPLTKAECEKEKDALGIKECNFDNDYWAGAVKACGGVNKMPSMSQLAEIANYIYNTDKVSDNNNVANLTKDKEKAASLGFKNASSTFYIWSGEEYLNDNARYRYLGPSSTNWDVHGERYRNYLQSVCIGY